MFGKCKWVILLPKFLQNAESRFSSPCIHGERRLPDSGKQLFGDSFEARLKRRSERANTVADAKEAGKSFFFVAPLTTPVYRWKIVKIPGPHCPHPYTQSFPPLSISPASGKSVLRSPRSYEVHLDSECLQEVNWSLEGQPDGSEREIPAPTSHRSGH